MNTVLVDFITGKSYGQLLPICLIIIGDIVVYEGTKYLVRERLYDHEAKLLSLKVRRLP